MFNSEIKSDIDNLRFSVRRLADMQYELSNRLALLMDYLELVTVEQPSRTIIKKSKLGRRDG